MPFYAAAPTTFATAPILNEQALSGETEPTADADATRNLTADADVTSNLTADADVASNLNHLYLPFSSQP